MAHLGEKQRSPLRKSFSPSRRQSLQTGSVCLAIDIPYILHSAPLGRAATIVRYGSNIGNRTDLDAQGLHSAHSRFAAGAGALDIEIGFLQAHVQSGLVPVP